LYDATAKARLTFEHLLTGDVISAYRLVAGPSVTENRLQIVRAVTLPDNQPVVGMRVLDTDLESMKYVLACQQEAVTLQSKDMAEKLKESIHDIAINSADILLQRLKEAENFSLEFASWVDLHKVLAEEGLVPRSVEGLRGVQQGVSRLEKKGLIWVRDGVIVLQENPDKRKLAQGEDLEVEMFPEEFDRVSDDDFWDNDSNSDGNLTDDLENLLNEDFDFEDLQNADDALEEDSSSLKRNVEHASGSKSGRKARRTDISDVSTPARALAEPKSSKKGKRKKNALLDADDSLLEGKEDEADAVDKLFGDTAGKSADSATTRDDSPGAKRKRREDMAKALFGDSDDDDDEAAAAQSEAAASLTKLFSGAANDDEAPQSPSCS